MACSWAPSPSTRQVLGSSPEPGGRAARAFFLHPPFLPPSGDSFFCTFPTKPTGRLGLKHTTGWDWVYYIPNTTKSYKNYLQNRQHVVLHNRPTLSIGTERLACLNNPPWCAAGHPRLARGRSRVRAPAEARFFSPPSLPSSFGK